MVLLVSCRRLRNFRKYIEKFLSGEQTYKRIQNAMNLILGDEILVNICCFYVNCLMYDIHVHLKNALVVCAEPAFETTLFNKRIKGRTASKERKIISVGHTSSSVPYRVEIPCCLNVRNWFCLLLQCMHLYLKMCLIFPDNFYITMQMSIRKFSQCL